MHAHVERLVSVVKMTTMLEEYITKKQHSAFFVDECTKCKGYSQTNVSPILLSSFWSITLV
jgi:hypothetical protein